MKKFFEALGGLGIVLYYILSLVIAVLPFVMIDVSFLLDLLFIGINMIFPPASIVFWVWGLVCAINGVQDVFAIIYYVAFAILWLPFFINSISIFFTRNNSNKESVPAQNTTEISQHQVELSLKEKNKKIDASVKRFFDYVYALMKIIDSEKTLLFKNDYVIADCFFIMGAKIKTELQQNNVPNYICDRFEKKLFERMDFKLSISYAELELMMKSRSAFYESLINEDSSLSCLFEEAEYVFTYDIYHDRFVEYGINSPLVILNFPLPLRVQSETNFFREKIFPDYKSIVKELSEI